LDVELDRASALATAWERAMVLVSGLEWAWVAVETKNSLASELESGRGGENDETQTRA